MNQWWGRLSVKTEPRMAQTGLLWPKTELIVAQLISQPDHPTFPMI